MIEKPEPKRDDKGLPWCDPECESYYIDHGYARCGINKCHVHSACVCLPQVQLDEAELAQSQAHVQELDIENDAYIDQIGRAHV